MYQNTPHGSRHILYTHNVRPNILTQCDIIRPIHSTIITFSIVKEQTNSFNTLQDPVILHIVLELFHYVSTKPILTSHQTFFSYTLPYQNDVSHLQYAPTLAQRRLLHHKLTRNMINLVYLRHRLNFPTASEANAQ